MTLLKKMVMDNKDKFKEFIKPILINEFEQQLTEHPEVLEEFENKGNGVYVSNTGVEFVLEEI